MKSVCSNLLVLFRSVGSLTFGQGMISGVLALVLAALCFFGAIAFHFPEYLTTPELRQRYDVASIRQLMFCSMLLAGALAVLNLALLRTLWLASWSLGLLALTAIMGGHNIAVGAFPTDVPYLGLDWLVLGLLGTAIIFITIEKLIPFRDQPVFRPEWQTDFQHFAVNHLLVGFTLLVTNFIINNVFGWANFSALQQGAHALPLWLAVPLVVLVADLAQYWTHRAYHQVPYLWRYHAIHHSTVHMDWLAGSRQHLLETIVTRTSVLLPLYLLGFSKEAIDVYVLIVGFQAVFNHANVSVRLGPLRYIIVTPNFHHWHHARDKEAIDRNYAAHFAFLDYLFGTAVSSDKKWPERYGVVGSYIPNGYWRQFLFPFVGSTKSREKPLKKKAEPRETVDEN